jgi:LAO/AO transport system kinase
VDLATGLLQGNRRALARALSVIEAGGPEARTLMQAVYTHAGKAHVVGITGAPGAGKSTFVNALALQLRKQGRTVAILAIDPSSPISGGAILGDRIRMQAHSGDTGTFIRSMANRGRLGGLARATDDAILLLDAAGYDIILVETVGAGQSEVEIARTADTTIVVEVPGMGDDIQSIKAGILEIADIFVVNKADRDGADATIRQLRAMLHMGAHEREWTPPILPTVAFREQGIAEVLDAIEKHRNYLKENQIATHYVYTRAAQQLQTILQETAFEKIRNYLGDARWQTLLAQVADHTSDPYTIAERVLDEIIGTT